MASLLAGLVGGLIATIVMTVVMMMVGDGGPPPTARLVSKFAGGTPEDHAMPGMALHMVYGLGAGVVFALGVPLVGLGFGSLGLAIGLGLVYGVVLMIGGMMFWMRTVIGMEPDRGTMTTFAAAHVTYGVVLGAFLWMGVLA
ncbi:MAG: hypothetical protein M8354_12850 [Halalkalicoccus sp.]|nr:hypothetical protein [Halalkalicoccus sp.]